MSYSVIEAKQILSRTPKVLKELLVGLDENWLNLRKRENAFTPSEVVGHLIANEQVNFKPRINYFLAGDSTKPFPRLDRDYTEKGFDKSLSLEKRLELFESLREKNLELLEKDVATTGSGIKSINPGLGEVNLSHLVSYWVVHDLTHIFQVTETLALRYKEEVGPWGDYLKLLQIPDGLAKTGFE